MNIFYKGKEPSVSQTLSIMREPKLLDRALRLSVLAPILVYVIIKLKSKTRISKFVNDYIIYLTIFLAISSFIDLLGYYYHGALGVYNRHIYFLATLISGLSFFAYYDDQKSFIKWLLSIWIITIFLLSIFKIPYSLTLAQNTNIDRYSTIARLLDTESIQKILGSYFTFGKLFIYLDIPSTKLKSLDSLYNPAINDYDFGRLKSFENLLIIDKKEIEKYVSMKGGFIVSYPLREKISELLQHYSYVFNSNYVFILSLIHI